MLEISNGVFLFDLSSPWKLKCFEKSSQNLSFERDEKGTGVLKTSLVDILKIILATVRLNENQGETKEY